MKVTYPFGQPAGYQLQSFGTLRTQLGVTQPSYRNGNVDHGKGALLFKFHNYFGPVEITISLEKIGRTGVLSDPVVIDVLKGGVRFVLFDEYSPRYDSNKTYCEIWVTSKGPNLDGDASVKFDIYRRWRA